MESVNLQDMTPFIVPPPKLSFHEELLKNNYDLQISNLESQIRLQNDMIKTKDEILISHIKRIDELTREVQKDSKKKDHSECVIKINEIVEHLKKSKSENDHMKTELFKCKFKEKHVEGYRDLNKVIEYDRKCVAIQIENLHMKSEIDHLRKSNDEKIKSIENLEKEISELENKESDLLEYEDEEICGQPILRESCVLLKCDFCEHSFHNKNMLKKHITYEHERKLLEKINFQKSNLVCSLSKVQWKERKSQNIHKCKQPCLIYHARFSYVKLKSQQILERMLKIRNSVWMECDVNDEKETDTTFHNPSVHTK